MPLKERVQAIQSLHPVMRIAGYLALSARAAEIGARLRTKHRSDLQWTQEENREWDAVVDEIDPWHYALSDEEHSLIAGFENNVLGQLCRGEMPIAETPSSLLPPPGPTLQT